MMIVMMQDYKLQLPWSALRIGRWGQRGGKGQGTGRQ